MIFLRGFDLLLRVLGGVFAIAIGAASALLEAVATPRGYLIAPIAAVGFNVFLCWFTRETIGTSWSWAFGALPWLIVMIACVSPTGEGDQLANSYPGLVTFAAGALTFFAFIAFRPLDRRPRVLTPAEPALQDQTL